VSVFEIALKASIGKLNIPFPEFEVGLARASGAETVSLTWEHACRSYDIAAAHADPFDRLLLTQAIAEPLYLLSTDASLAGYGGEFVMSSTESV
jgi:PIN domain nuclease of toxin-antitoxin system